MLRKNYRSNILLSAVFLSLIAVPMPNAALAQGEAVQDVPGTLPRIAGKCTKRGVAMGGFDLVSYFDEE